MSSHVANEVQSPPPCPTPDPPPPPDSVLGTVRDRTWKLALTLSLLGVGLAHALIPLAPLITGHPAGLPASERFRLLITAVMTLMAYGLAVLVISWVMDVCIAAVRSLGDQAEASRRSADLLQRIATALERAPVAPATQGGESAADARARALAEVRRAIRDAEWDLAGARVQEFADAHPEDPAAPRLADELTEARRTAADDLHARIGAAREAHDADRVLELREALRPLVPGDALRDLDRNLSAWLMGVIQGRLRVIPIQADVVVLAGRVAEHFDDTKEGASLRAALPTLRRSVGLCPRCGEPYTGVADACPKCLGVPTAPDPEPTTPAAAPEGAPAPNRTIESAPTMAVEPDEDDAPFPPISEELENFREFLEPPT